MLHPFDLQERAALAARSLTALLDPARQGLMYFLANWAARPPRADHCLWDCGDGTGRHLDALVRLRRMVRPDSGASEATVGERLLEGWMMRLLGPQGLTWLVDEPFARPWGTDIFLRRYDPQAAYAEVSWAQRGTLLGLTTCFQASGDECYLAAGQRLVDGLLVVARRSAQGLYFPEGYYGADGWSSTEPGLYPGLEEYNAAVVVPAVRFYRATGYEPALQLAEGLVGHALAHTTGYLPDGRLYAGEGPARGQGTLDHFHTRTNFLLGVLELGLAAARPELVEWARRSYARAAAWGTDFGWFPEGMGHRHGEICCTTDMIEAALLLGRHADRAYYADAERFGRNHLIESQLLSLAALEAGAARLPADTSAAPHEGRYSTTQGVARSQIGGFAARSTLNDALHPDAPAMMQCCNAAGGRALWDLWCHAVERHVVHLRLSVATPALRVVSHEPTEGRLDLAAAQDGPLAVRLPAGVAQAEVTEEGAARALWAADGYVQLQVRAGVPLVLRYALPERTAEYEVGKPGRTLRCVGRWRGETLVSMEPQGPYVPLYQRRMDLPAAQPVRPVLPALPPLGGA